MTRQLKAILLCVVALGCSGNESHDVARAEADPTEPDFTLSMDEVTEAQWEALPFERLSMSRSGCYGRCPVYKVEVFKGGQALYDGGDYAPRQGSFSGVLGFYEFGLLNSLASRTDLWELNDSYQAGWTDDETVTIELEGKSGTKSISDYGRQGPAELQAFHALFDDLVERVEWEPVAKDR